MSSTEELVAAWLANQTNKNTRDAYRRVINEFLDWCEEHHVNPVRARLTNLTPWSSQMQAQCPGGGSVLPSTQARKLATVSSWYTFLVQAGVRPDNPMAGVKRPKVNTDPKGIGLTTDEAKSLLKVAKDSGAQAHALVLLGTMNGLRVSEAVSLRCERITEESGFTVIEFEGKGGKTYKAPLPKAVAKAVLELRGERTSGWLFRGPDGLPLSRFAALRIIKGLGKRAGVSDSLTPHDLRRSFVTIALRNGISLYEVQQGARHADPRTTAGYDRAVRGIEEHIGHRLGDILDGDAA